MIRNVDQKTIIELGNSAHYNNPDTIVSTRSGDSVLVSGSLWSTAVSSSTRQWLGSHHAADTRIAGSYPTVYITPTTASNLQTGTAASGMEDDIKMIPYDQQKDHTVHINPMNACYRYIRLEVGKWQVDDWYRRQHSSTTSPNTLHNNFYDYDHLDIYVGLPENNTASTYSETFWARLGGMPYAAMQVTGSWTTNAAAYHTGGRLASTGSEGVYWIDTARVRRAMIGPDDANGRYLENGIKTAGSTAVGPARGVLEATSSVGQVMFYWHAGNSNSALASTYGRWFEITCSFHEDVSTKAVGEQWLIRQNPGFVQYPSVTPSGSSAGTKQYGLSGSMEGDTTPLSTRTAPPEYRCPRDPVNNLLHKSNISSFQFNNDVECDTGEIQVQWAEATSSAGYTVYHLYRDDGTGGVSPADPNTYEEMVRLWGSCAPPTASRSGSNNVVTHTFRNLNAGDSGTQYSFYLYAYDLCGTGSQALNSTVHGPFVTAITGTGDLSCATRYYYGDDFTIHYYKCLPKQFTKKHGVTVCDSDHIVPYSYGSRSTIIRGTGEAGVNVDLSYSGTLG